MNIIENLKKTIKPSKDYVFQEINVKETPIFIIYNSTLTNANNLSQYLFIPLQKLSKKELKNLHTSLPIGNGILLKEKEILSYLNQGYVIVMNNKIVAFPMPLNLSRGVTTIESELSLSGPKDCFSEQYSTNLGLLRRRIKSEKLKCQEIEVGRYTKTRIGIIYIQGIVKPDLVRHVIKNLSKIDIDGILDSSYLKSSFEKKYQLFPTIMMTERPDKSSMALLEGKVVILVDTSPYALILPNFFLDCFHTTDDYFQKPFHASFIRLIRLLAFIIALYIPAIYLAITTRNYSIVSLDLLLMLKAGRSFVPFPAYMEAIFMIICFEILKESDLRMSTTSGSAVSILGGLILGDAAVAAGIVSPIMIIVIAISSISGLIFTSIELENTLRTYKIFFLLLATIFGILGVIYGTIIMINQLLKTEIFGYHYFSFREIDGKDSLIRTHSPIRKRNPYLTNNRIRGRYQ